MPTAAEAFLRGKGPIVEALRPFAAGEAKWEETRDKLAAVKWADDDTATNDQLMGRDGGKYVLDHEPGNPAKPGTWAQVKEARNYGLLTAEQVAEVFAATTKAGK